MLKKLRYLIFLPIMLFWFQNCGTGFSKLESATNKAAESLPGSDEANGENEEASLPPVTNPVIKVVILGASTPAGKNIFKLFPGATPAEEQIYADLYSWPSLVQNHLKLLNSSSQVINLAKAG